MMPAPLNGRLLPLPRPSDNARRSAHHHAPKARPHALRAPGPDPRACNDSSEHRAPPARAAGLAHARRGEEDRGERRERGKFGSGERELPNGEVEEGDRERGQDGPSLVGCSWGCSVLSFIYVANKAFFFRFGAEGREREVCAGLSEKEDVQK